MTICVCKVCVCKLNIGEHIGNIAASLHSRCTTCHVKANTFARKNCGKDINIVVILNTKIEKQHKEGIFVSFHFASFIFFLFWFFPIFFVAQFFVPKHIYGIFIFYNISCRLLQNTWNMCTKRIFVTEIWNVLNVPFSFLSSFEIASK